MHHCFFTRKQSGCILFFGGKTRYSRTNVIELAFKYNSELITRLLVLLISKHIKTCRAQIYALMLKLIECDNKTSIMMHISNIFIRSYHGIIVIWCLNYLFSNQINMQIVFENSERSTRQLKILTGKFACIIVIGWPAAESEGKTSNQKSLFSFYTQYINQRLHKH